MTRQVQRSIVVSLLFLALALLPAVPTMAADDDAFSSAVRQHLEQTLAAAREDGQIEEVAKRTRQLFDIVVLYADQDDHDLFREAAYARRLMSLVSEEEPDLQAATLRLLLDHPNTAQTLAFLIHEKEKPDKVFEVLRKLHAAHGEAIESYPTLTAAICVVHDRRIPQRVNENSAHSPDPIALFHYYVKNEKRMLFGIKDVPAELLVYVVDIAASIDEMNWALQHYAGDTNVGARFFDIEYDHDHLNKGKPKRVTVAGWNLVNIRRFGGVCADQAYFAMTVGKAIGVPTTYTVGKSADVSHAWVGFLQSDGKRAWWNFNTGRYAAYQGVRGVVRDPQTRLMIPDSTISLQAESFRTSTEQRRTAAAFSDAARHLLVMPADHTMEEVMAELEITPENSRRERSIDISLQLLEEGLRACPSYGPGWHTLATFANRNFLTLDHKKRWADVLHNLCGQRYPDFYLEILRPMITRVRDVQQQNKLWNAAFRNFQGRHDLAAEVRLEQGDMWKRSGDLRKAGQCYEDVIMRYANAGPFAVMALAKAESLLRQAGDGRRLLMLYDRAWSLTKKPSYDNPQFYKQSNWYKIGARYRKLLNESGQRNHADQVGRALSP